MNNPSTKKRIEQSISTIYWGCYLFFIVWLSFLPVRIDTSPWQVFLIGFYSFVALFCISWLLGLRVRTRALHSARFLLALMLSVILLLLAQQLLPGTILSLIVPGEGASYPSWFSPQLRLSATPEKTYWLFLSEIFIFLLTIVSLCLIDSRRRLKQLLWLIAIVGCSHTLIAMNAYIEGKHLVNVAELDGHFDVARGLFVNRNHFSAFIVLSTVGSLCFLFKHLSQNAFKINSLNMIFLFAVTLMVVSFVGLISSQSRGGVLSLVVALLAVLIARRSRVGTFAVSWKVLVSSFLVLMFCSLYFTPVLLERLLLEGISLGERPMQWMITMKAIAGAPWLGYGGGSYGSIFQIFREGVDLRDVVYNQSHNQFLHTWLEQGLLGLALWLSILAVVFKQTIKVSRFNKSSLIRSCNAACIVVLGAAVLQSCVDFNLQILNIRGYFFVIIAIAFASPHIRQKIVGAI